MVPMDAVMEIAPTISMKFSVSRDLPSTDIRDQMSQHDQRDYLRRRAARLKKAGLCVDCKRRANTGVRCKDCAAKNRKRTKFRVRYNSPAWWTNLPNLAEPI